MECSQHPDVQQNVISQGDEKIADRGVPVARQRHRARCGCNLISSIV
ncbi:PAAR domain-containing protein [Paraburkholderia strydomiana]